MLAKSRARARAHGATEQRAAGGLAVLAFPAGGWGPYLDALATATMQAERQDLRFAAVEDPAEDGLAGPRGHGRPLHLRQPRPPAALDRAPGQESSI